LPGSDLDSAAVVGYRHHPALRQNRRIFDGRRANDEECSMLQLLRPLAFALVLGAFGLAAAQAQQGDGKPAPANGNPGAEPRDPTKPSPDLKKALDVGKQTQPGVAAAPARAGVITLRARVIVKDRPPIAYIDVDKQQYAIGPDTKITVGGVTLTVLEISAAQVRLKLEPLNEILVLR